MALYFYFGTTAEYIKLAPVLKAFKKFKIEYKIVLSGQTSVLTNELSSIAGKQKIYINFESKSKQSSPYQFALWGIRTFVRTSLWANKDIDKNDVVIVQGDTVTSLIGGVVAKLFKAKLVHIEAGLRTHNLLSPFPEEICRTLLGYITDINFCPNKKAFKNISKKSSKKVSTEYNTSIESLSAALRLNKKPKNIIVDDKQKYFIFIVHRQEHLYLNKNKTKQLIETVIKNINPKVKCVYIAHDITKTYLKSLGLWQKFKNNANIILQPRLPYVDFINLLDKSEFIITDGGGNQTESHFLGKPCLIFRKSTEQSEGLGENVLLGGESSEVIEGFIKNYKQYKRPKQKVQELPSEIIVKTLIPILQ